MNGNSGNLRLCIYTDIACTALSRCTSIVIGHDVRKDTDALSLTRRLSAGIGHLIRRKTWLGQLYKLKMRGCASQVLRSVAMADWSALL